MKVRNKMVKAMVVIGFLILIAPVFATAQGIRQIRVNCDRGQSVQRALDLLDRFDMPATLVVTGTCNENVVIKQDDVNIQGGNFVGPDPNQNTILVQAARRVLITGVTVGGGYNGITAY